MSRHSIAVTAYQQDDYGRMRLTGEPSERVFVSDNTGVESVSVDSDGEPVYYDLQGRRVASPRPGSLVIRLQGGVASKVAM